ncbi:DUF1203 domain-containing protein [Sphingosinicella sp. LY1275]|uniref:DUF1203 domain-containing protein n=1 Tax=Sphingosinicella sp. LY1275 TaxID=3095379 RepID=UPI002ADEDD68|nr:DUF1203 domain-containing protein [Sphingosinicella sp. LY1275]MEA1013804.1 DUF1203 domain-containing protein [Sphingosinicella sp. LY1275]
MYRIEGLSPDAFEPLVGLPDARLAERGVMRVTADAKPGFPCRVTLEDAEPGESLLLLNHVSHDVATPYRTAYAIYVRERARAPTSFEDSLPPVFAGRTLSLRGFDRSGMLRGAVLALPGEAEARIKELLERPEIATIHVHNAAYGCFVARVERN